MVIIILTQKIYPALCACFYSQNKISALPSHVFKLKFSCNFCFQGQFGYGGADDLWNVNGGVPFTAASSTGTTHNNNAYYVQVSNSFSINTYICVCLSVFYHKMGPKLFWSCKNQPGSSIMYNYRIVASSSLVLQHMQAFSDCLWRRFFILM